MLNHLQSIFLLAPIFLTSCISFQTEKGEKKRLEEKNESQRSITPRSEDAIAKLGDLLSRVERYFRGSCRLRQALHTIRSSIARFTVTPVFPNSTGITGYTEASNSTKASAINSSSQSSLHLPLPHPKSLELEFRYH